jgi:chaperone modulatory protein CbpM
MTELFSEDHIITMVPGLTLDRLFSFIEARLVIPTAALADENGGQLFSLIDIARLHLLCDLSDDLGLDEPTLDVVMALVDELHAARSDLRILARAIGTEESDVRTRLGMVFMRSVPRSD